MLETYSTRKFVLDSSSINYCTNIFLKRRPLWAPFLFISIMNHANANIDWDGKCYEVDFSSPIDISLAIKDPRIEKGASAWYVDGPKFEPIRTDGFVGKVAEGG